MRFQIPQFIETEINIVGPFTLKQFLWVAAGGTLLFLDFSVLSGTPAVLTAIPIAAVAAAFAFLKIDDMPLINYVANALSFSMGNKRYVYTKEDVSGLPSDKPAAPPTTGPEAPTEEDPNIQRYAK